MNRFILAGIVVSFGLTSCKTRDTLEIKTPPACSQSGISFNHSGLDGCNYLIFGDDGIVYQPINIPDTSFKFKHGERIRYDLVTTNLPNICMVGTTADLTCLKSTDSLICQDFLPGFSYADTVLSEGASEYRILNHLTSKGMLTLEIAFSGCSSERDFEFRISNFAMKSLPPQRTAALNFESQSCLAYFTRKICVDIRNLKEATYLLIAHSDGEYRVLVEP